MKAVVIGIGNEFRRDDGIGPAVAEAVSRLALPGVEVHSSAGDPGDLLDAWDGVDIAVIVDAAAGPDACPGRLRRWAPGRDHPPASVSSHALEPLSTHALGTAVGRVPQELVVLTVDVADVGHGVGLSPELAAAIPVAVTAVMEEIERRGPTPQDRGPKTPQPSV